MNDIQKNFPQPVSGTVTPRFGDIATFMRLPLFRDPADVEIGMVGVPWDGGTTNRPGARHGPRQMRDLSTMMRRIHHVTRVAPYELAKCGDLGDAPVNPASLDDSLERIEKFYARLHAAGAVPLLSLSGPPTFEAGCFVEAPATRLTKNSAWEVNDDTRPPRLRGPQHHDRRRRR